MCIYIHIFIHICIYIYTCIYTIIYINVYLCILSQTGKLPVRYNSPYHPKKGGEGRREEKMGERAQCG